MIKRFVLASIFALGFEQVAQAQEPAPAPTPSADASAQAAPSPAGTAPAGSSAPPPPPGQAAPPPGQAAPPPGQAAPPPGQAAPPPQGYPPPAQYPGAYPPPQYPQYPPYYGPYAPPPPRTLPYEEGQPIPPGYRLESGVRKGPVIAGSIVLGVPYVLGLTIASEDNFSNSSGWLVVPAVGPWFTLAARKSCDTSSSSTCVDDGVRTVLILDALMQTAGATLLIVGIAIPRKELRRADVAKIELVPRVGPDQVGLAAVGTF